jgi:Tol biopolymer transport system component
MAVHIGSKLGPFEILAPLGAGGMGEVYRARDSRLQRTVAIKILPESLSADSDRRARFLREARILASFNHPNIATLYGVEETTSGQLLVMELVDGETLADRLARTGVNSSVRVTLDIALQVAAALEAAHERGIVHRDLKPSNIMVRTDGTVKVLDFGVARTLEDAAAGTLSSPTVTELEAGHGVGPGTPPYMSPEQARGEPAGRHADIWAFGAVLYELLTGVSPFARATTAETLAAVLGERPDDTRLPKDTPPSARRVIGRCLQKDLTRRLQHIGDARIELADTLEAPTIEAEAEHRGAGRVPRTGRWAAVAAGLATIALVILGVLAYRAEPAGTPRPVRFLVLPPDRGAFQTPVMAGASAPVGGTISPDGRTLAFTATDSSGNTLLWVRPLDALAPRAIPGTDDAALPFWSPDSSAIGFFTLGKLKRTELASGATRELCEVSRGRGGSWNRDGVIVFAGTLAGGLSRIAADGGEPQEITKLADGQRSHRFPFFLADGRHFLYYVEAATADDSGVFVGALDGSAARRVLAADSAAIHARSGHLLFVRRGTLFAQPFDGAGLRVLGEPAAVAESIPSEGSSPAFSVSDTGVLTYALGGIDQHQFGWFDSTGRLLETVGEPGRYRGVDLSPDGTRIAVHRHDRNGGDIWVLERRGAKTRVTFDPSQDNSSPVWSPDGTRIVFASLRQGRWGLYEKRADVTETDTLLVESDAAISPASWSRDGKYIVYWSFPPQGGVDQRLLQVLGGEREAGPLLQSRFAETHGQISPDGRWIAYASNTTGRLEVYVRPFPSGARVFQVSTTGGVMPRWRSDTKELFYATAYDRPRLMAVTVRGDGSAFASDVARELFDMGTIPPPHSATIPTYHAYAVSPDGKRFLVSRPVAAFRDDAAEATISVVLNWTALLDR